MRNISKSLLLSLSAGSLVVGVAACGSSQSPAARTSAQHDALPAQAGRPAGLITANARLTALALSSPERGDGLFATSDGSRCEAVAAATSDGGRRFTDAAVIASWNCSGTPRVQSLTTDANGDEFAYGPQLFLRGNEARAWLASRQPGVVLAVSAAGRSVWMLLSDRAPSGCRLVVLETANGGHSWHPARSQPPGMSGCPGPGIGEGAAGQTWLVHTGPASGYVLAAPSVNNRGKADSVPLWYTGNGGISWSRRTIPCGLDALSAVLSVAPGGALAAVCAGEPAAGSQAKSTATSHDGGRSWTVHVGCQLLEPCRNPGPLMNGYLGQIAAVSAGTVYLVGQRSSLMVTTDGGEHWRLSRPVIGDSGGGTMQVIFFGGSDAVVLGDDGSDNEQPAIWHSADGGRRWAAVFPVLV